MVLKDALENVLAVWDIYMEFMGTSNRPEDGEDTSWAVFRSLLSINHRTVAASQPI